MPGVNNPPNEYLLQLIGELQKQVRAIGTQQQLAFTNAVGEIIAALGLLPASGGNYGLAAYAGATGNAVLAVADTDIPDGSGRRQTYVEMARDDGTPALVLADLGTVLNHPHQQALAWFDRAGNTVIADDTVGGTGIARPHLLAVAMANTNVATWPASNSATMTAIAAGVMEYQQPKLQWTVEVYCPASTNATFEIQVNSSTLATFTNSGGASGAFATWNDTKPMPSGLAFGTIYSIQLLAQVTAGTGTVSAVPYLIQGVGT